jgi:uncharacterized membrane protein YuzA (DUF378 family)
MDQKKLVAWLLVIGGLNWGLVGLAGLLGGDNNWNVVNLLLGSWSALENLVYVVVGLAALWKAYMLVGGGNK